MVADVVIPTSAKEHLRRIDMRRDLGAVADLVEICFFDTLDPEGKHYLANMRKAAQSARLLGWAGSLAEEAPMPPSGYIWEEDGRLVGNLSLIPINVQNKRGYMIANVATHPDYRGRGIARALTTTALEYARSRNAACVWLQVRDDNPSAIHIYETTGFKERLRRTGWFSGPDPQDNPTPAGVRVTKRRSVHWQAQRDWLKRSYPPELAWHIPFDWNLMRLDMWGMLYRFLIFEYPHHWVVERGGQLKGVLTWRHTSGYTDPLWLAVPDEVDEGAILALVGQARRHIRQIQPLSLNYPAGVMVDVLRQAGFYPHQTLIWMEFIFPG